MSSCVVLCTHTAHLHKHNIKIYFAIRICNNLQIHSDYIIILYYYYYYYYIMFIYLFIYLYFTYLF